LAWWRSASPGEPQYLAHSVLLRPADAVLRALPRQPSAPVAELVLVAAEAQLEVVAELQTLV
jgi:hypothetical protein